mgnify:CR=1 FL=1
MKKLTGLFFLLFTISILSQQTMMHIQKTDGSKDTIRLSDIVKIYFTNAGPNPSNAGMLFYRYNSGNYANSDIYKMNADGSGSVKLIDRGGIEAYAKWSDDLSKIVFTSNASTTNAQEIFIANFDGTGQQQLTNSAPQYGNSNAIFRSSTKIWYANAQSTGVTEIWEVNTDGTGNHQLTNFSSIPKSGDIYDFNSSKTKVLYYKQNPSWSPTGELYIANIDWSGEIQLTSNGVVDAQGDISPDGTKIVFYHNESPSGYNSPNNIYIMNSNGTQSVKLTNFTGNNSGFSPRFSPDGTKIAYCYHNGTQQDIIVMNLDGTNQVNITNTPDVDEALTDWR